VSGAILWLCMMVSMQVLVMCYYLCQGGHVFASVCLFVCLSMIGIMRNVFK